MASKKDVLQVVTANRLHDGLVVYFDDKSCWTENMDKALVLQTKEEAEINLEKARAAIARNIVEPYLIDLEIEDHRLVPVRYREKLRTLGPSVRLDLGRQAESNAGQSGIAHVQV